MVPQQELTPQSSGGSISSIVGMSVFNEDGIKIGMQQNKLPLMVDNLLYLVISRK